MGAMSGRSQDRKSEPGLGGSSKDQQCEATGMVTAPDRGPARLAPTSVRRAYLEGTGKMAGGRNVNLAILRLCRPIQVRGMIGALPPGCKGGPIFPEH